MLFVICKYGLLPSISRMGHPSIGKHFCSVPKIIEIFPFTYMYNLPNHKFVNKPLVTRVSI